MRLYAEKIRDQVALTYEESGFQEGLLQFSQNQLKHIYNTGAIL